MKLKTVLLVMTPVLVLCVGLTLFLTLTAPKRTESDGLLTDSRILTEECGENGTAYTLTLSNCTREVATLGAPTFQYKEGNEWKDTGGKVSCPEEIRLSALSSVELEISVEAGDSTAANDSSVLSVSSLQNFSPTGEYRLLFPAKDSKGDTFSVTASVTPMEDRGFVCGVTEDRDGMLQNDLVTLRVEKNAAGQYRCTLENGTGTVISVEDSFITLQQNTKKGWKKLDPYPEGHIYYDTTVLMNPQSSHGNTVLIPDVPGEYRVLAEYNLGGQTCYAVATVTVEFPKDAKVALRVDKTGAGQYRCTLENPTGSVISFEYSFVALQRKTETGWETLDPYPEGHIYYDTVVLLNPLGSRSNTILIPDVAGEYRIIAEYQQEGETRSVIVTLTVE